MSVGTTDLRREGEPGGPLVDVTDVQVAEVIARSPLQLFWRRLRGDRVALVAAGFIVLLVVVAIFAPVVVDLAGVPGPDVQNPNLTDQFGQALGPTAGHPFGVDPLGRDVLARVVYGARVSLQVAIIATALSVMIGVTVGMVAGYYRGWVDTVLSRGIDVMLAFPVLLLALGIGSSCALGNGCLGGLIRPGLGTVIFVIAFVNWTYIARIIRGQVLSLREKEFVEAARALGASNRRIIFRELLPNLVAPIIVYSSLIIPTNIIFEAALSFLGVGVQPPTASWGAMISEAARLSVTATSVWWYMLFPGLALLLTVLAFNLLGDGLQDALNPRTGTGK